MIFFQAC